MSVFSLILRTFATKSTINDKPALMKINAMALRQKGDNPLTEAKTTTFNVSRASIH